MCCPGSVMAIVTTGEDGRIFFLNRQNMSVKMADESSKSGSLPKQSQWNRSTKPMGSFSKSIEIVERFHCFCSVKPPVSALRFSGFESWDYRISWVKGVADNTYRTEMRRRKRRKRLSVARETPATSATR
jgi:hypothetical protein